MAVKKAPGKRTTKKKVGRAASLTRASKKLADKALAAFSPQLEAKIDQLMKTLENSRAGNLGDLSLLAGKILMRAQDVSRSLRQIEKPKPTKRKKP